MQDIIQNKPGRWTTIGNLTIFVNDKNKVILPTSLKNQSAENLDLSNYQPPDVDPNKLNLIKSLIVANSINYERLSSYLTNLANIIKLGDEPNAEQDCFEKFNQFVHSYSPIDIKMKDFLKKYLQQNQSLIEQLKQAVATNNPPPKVVSNVPKEKHENPNVKKFGLYKFPFLSQEKLFLGDIEQYKQLPQIWDYSGTHWKQFYSIDNNIFLANGYHQDEYNCVNRVLASQLGKLFGLSCEEVFLGYLHDKAVTLTYFTEAITLFENQMFELYELDSLGYVYQSEQKRMFYFLIQHWCPYAKTPRGVLERFSEHFVNPDGGVFLSNHQEAMFRTPKQMPVNILVPLEINKSNYRAIKDCLQRVGDKDLAEIAFSSIPQEFVDLHDSHANKMNKPTFIEKKTSFDSNWENLKNSIEEFEQMPKAMVR